MDLVITSVPDHITVNEVLSLKQSGVFSDHGVVCFEFNAFVKASTKFHHEGLYASLNAIGLQLQLQTIAILTRTGENGKTLFSPPWRIISQ